MTHHFGTVLSVQETNFNGNINLVIELVTNFRKNREIVSLAYFNLVISCSLVVITKFTTYPKLSVCCERHYCNECSQKNFFHSA